MSDRRAVTWAIVGTGQISRTLVPDLQSVSGSSVVAVTSRTLANAEAFAAGLDIPDALLFEEALLDPGITAMYIATPFATHYEHASRAITAGKHVLIEKPMAMNAHEVTSLFALARAAGVFLMEAMWMKFNPALLELLDDLRAGAIGEPRTLKAAFSFPVPRSLESRWNPQASPGALLDQGIYGITLAHTLFGVPTRVTAAGVLENGVDVSSNIQLDFTGGRAAQLASSMIEHADTRALIGGTAGWASIGMLHWAATQTSLHSGSITDMFERPIVRNHPHDGAGYQPMLRHVVAAISRGELTSSVHGEQATTEVFHTMDLVRSHNHTSVPGPARRKEPTQ